MKDFGIPPELLNDGKIRTGVSENLDLLTDEEIREIYTAIVDKMWSWNDQAQLIREELESRGETI
jgi:hypothetical protein